MKIPLFKVLMSKDAPGRVAETLLSGQLAEGPRVLEFEEQLRATLGTERELLTVNSCTSAIELALHMIDVRDRPVITTAQTCTATNTAILAQGGKLIWADIDPRTGLIAPASVRQLLPVRPAAIVAVDWGGAPCDYDTLRSFGVPVVEDAAHAFLSTRGGRSLADAGGDYVCWSFQAIKHLTTGDGGLLRVPPGLEKRARLLRWYGLDRRSKASFRCEQDIEEAGYKFHMNDVAATIGLSNLAEARSAVGAHRANARFYAEALKDVAVEDLDGRWAGRPLTLPPANDESAWWLYTLLVERRDDFIAYLAEHGIEASPVHARNDRHSAFAKARSPTLLPGLDHFASREVAIPVGWWLTQAELDHIVETIKQWAASS